MAKMKAIGALKALDTSDEQFLTDLTLDKPTPTGRQVLVAVSAVSVNPVDTKMRLTVTDETAPKILGYDAVGTVAAVGPDVEKFKVGDRLYYAGSSQVDGSDEEYQLVDERLACNAPKALSDAEAAAMPLTTLTAYELLFEKMHFVPKGNQNQNKTLLIVNGSGGVGSILSQLAHWAGLTVLATSSPKNFDWLKRHGVDYPLDYHEDLLSQIHDLGYQQLDAIAILYAPEAYFEAASELVKPFGHIGSIVGSTVDLPLYLIKNKAASFDWEYMFAKSDANYRVHTQGKILQLACRLLDQGVLESTLTTNIETGINAANLRKAHQLVEAGHTLGKLVVSGPFNGQA